MFGDVHRAVVTHGMYLETVFMSYRQPFPAKTRVTGQFSSVDAAAAASVSMRRQTSVAGSERLHCPQG
jgi:hypothetical protein